MSDKAKPKSDKWVVAATVIGWMVVAAAVLQLLFLVNFAHYRFLHQYLPDTLILPRYLVSIAIRLVMLACGIGVLKRREFFRRLLIATCFLTILTLYWKHPMASFKSILIQLQHRGLLINPELYPFLLWSLLGIVCVSDILNSVLLVYFYSRPKVIVQFTDRVGSV